ncbi:hypothetical protein LXL04_016292 [Taraxacum kok-saghyz]
MASLLDYLNCFSETSPTGKLVCDGDVCVLSKSRSVGGGGSDTIMDLNTSLVDLVRNFEVPFPFPSDNRFEPNNEFGFDDPYSECSSESLSHIDDASDTPVVEYMNDVGNLEDNDICKPQNEQF